MTEVKVIAAYWRVLVDRKLVSTHRTKAEADRAADALRRGSEAADGADRCPKVGQFYPGVGGEAIIERRCVKPAGHDGRHSFHPKGGGL